MSVVNRTGGLINVTMLGKDLTSNEVDIYQILIKTGDPVTFSSDPLSSGNYDYQTVRGKDGSIIGQVQLDEQDPAGEISFSFYEDFDFLGNDYIYRNSKNRLINLLNGEAFINGENTVVPIGTNGTDKTKTARAKLREMNKPYKMVYYNEGEFIKENGTADEKTGEVALKKNPYKDTFNQSHKTFSMEFQTTSGQGQVSRMFPILAKTTAEWAEGDINQFNLTAQRGCDMVERDEFFTEIFKENIPEGTAPLKEFYVDYLILNGGTEPASAKQNETAIVVGADGTVTFKKKGASAWEDTENANMKKRIVVGTRIKTNHVILAGRGENNKNVNTFAVMSMDGTHLVDFSTNNSKRFYCVVKDYNKDTAKFEDYLSE